MEVEGNFGRQWIYVYGLDGREGCENVCLSPNSWTLHILNIYSFLYVSLTSIKCFGFF